MREECSSVARGICERADFDYHRAFYQARRQAFKDSLDISDFQNLICRNFKLKSAPLDLEANLYFGRSCRFSNYYRILRMRNIQICQDFRLFGADDNFLANCRDFLSKRMASYLSEKALPRVQEILAQVKAELARAVEKELYAAAVQRALDNILPLPYLSQGLQSIEAGFVKAQDLCAGEGYSLLCATYGDSQKSAFSPGGFLFLPGETLKTVIAKKVAEFVAGSDLVHRQMYSDRINLYAKFFYSRENSLPLESLVARGHVLDSLNTHINSLVLLRKFYKTQREVRDELFFVRAGYYCYQDHRLAGLGDRKRDEFYQSSFKELFALDQVETLSCSEETF